jgi:hypothetical protein
VWLHVYCRRCEQIDARYPDADAKVVVSKLLGADVNRDEASGSASTGVTGEQGGKLLACFLVRTEMADGTPSFLANGSKAWLEKQLPKCALFPSAKQCVEQAIKFLPKLKAGLAKAQTERGPVLDFD